MHPPWRLELLTFACLAALLCTGCAVSASTEQASLDYVPAEVQLGSANPVVSESRIDSVNRYLSTVLVSTTFFIPKQGTKVKTCSGVIIQDHLVLTAGHCVCDVRQPVPPEPSGTAITDSSTCAKSATITVLRYGAPEKSSHAISGGELPVPPAVGIGPYSGTVQAHEDLRIIYKEIETAAGWTTTTESSHADLAVIVLEESLQRYARLVKLSEEPVHLKDRVVLVGYGSDVLGEAMSAPVRRYGENQVVSIKDDGSTFHIGTHLEIEPTYSGEKPGVVRKRGSYTAAGDSGGPCFRERKGVLELVGIARSTHGPPVVLSVYTSTHSYLAWLRQKLASAGSGHTD